MALTFEPIPCYVAFDELDDDKLDLMRALDRTKDLSMKHYSLSPVLGERMLSFKISIDHITEDVRSALMKVMDKLAPREIRYFFNISEDRYNRQKDNIIKLFDSIKGFEGLRITNDRGNYLGFTTIFIPFQVLISEEFQVFIGNNKSVDINFSPDTSFINDQRRNL